MAKRSNGQLPHPISVVAAIFTQKLHRFRRRDLSLSHDPVAGAQTVRGSGSIVDPQADAAMDRVADRLRAQRPR
jgi:hypothetical protein